VARYLLAQYQARLILVGRTPLHDRGSPEQVEIMAQRRAAYQELARLGGSVIYQDVDICDAPRLREVVEQARSEWSCDLDGVIHLAGIFQERMLVDETRESLSATLRPKMLGAWSLAQLLEGVPDALFISFSSVNGFFGGVGVSAYAAANSFLMAFADAQQASLHSYCFSWSMWDELGISQHYLLKEASRRRGYQAISPSQGMVSLLAGLSARQPQLLVGLDGGNQRIRHTIAQQPYCLQALTAYFTADAGPWPAERMPALEISDRFGRPASCDFVRVEALPLTEAGAIDRERLAAQGARNSRAAAERAAPRTEAEHQIAQIWETLLGLPAVGIHDSFFGLGGDSLLAARVVAQVQERMGVELPLRSFFERPTVAGVARYIEVVSEIVSDRSPTRTVGEKRERVEF
jgi:acyl carrier protein